MGVITVSNSARNRPSGEPFVKPARTAAKTGKTRITTAQKPAPKADKAGKTSQQTAVASGSPVKTRRPAAKKTPAAKRTKAKTAQRDLQPKIAEIAYLIAEREGFPAGRELEHWLQAEVLVVEMFEDD